MPDERTVFPPFPVSLDLLRAAFAELVFDDAWPARILPQKVLHPFNPAMSGRPHLLRERLDGRKLLIGGIRLKTDDLPSLHDGLRRHERPRQLRHGPGHHRLQRLAGAGFVAVLLHRFQNAGRIPPGIAKPDRLPVPKCHPAVEHLRQIHER